MELIQLFNKHSVSELHLVNIMVKTFLKEKWSMINRCRIQFPFGTNFIQIKFLLYIFNFYLLFHTCLN